MEKTPQGAQSGTQEWKHLHVRGENTTESGLFTLYMRYIEPVHAIFVKEQNNLLVFPLSYQTFDLFLGKKGNQDKKYTDTITQKLRFFTIIYP